MRRDFPVSVREIGKSGGRNRYEDIRGVTMIGEEITRMNTLAIISPYE